MKHQPVLLEQSINAVKEISDGRGLFIDGTFGRGGHLRAFMAARPDLKFLAIDCDEDAIEYGRIAFAEEISEKKLTLVRGNFVNIDECIRSAGLEQIPVVGIFLDLGVSSPQLDEGPRGFSFYNDGPLDMRMDRRVEITAADIVNNWGEDELNELFKNWGEVQRPYRVTEKILAQRRTQPFKRTHELADLIVKSEGWRQKGHHPATQYFLALRIEVNRELEVVKNLMPVAVQHLSSKGRLFVITFHSLEDRLVKVAFKDFVESELGNLVNKKVIQAEWVEKKQNPRARSAKLRIFEKK